MRSRLLAAAWVAAGLLCTGTITASPDDRTEVIASLWLHIDGYPTGKYMTRLGDSGTFDIRADYLDVDFDALGAGPASMMTTTFPGGSVTYERVEAQLLPE